MTLFKWTGDNSHSFEFEAVGYRNNAEDLDPDNDECFEWIVVKVKAENQIDTWCESDPCMCTFDLVWFRDWLDNVVQEPHKEAIWDAYYEPYIEVHFIESFADWYHFAIVLNGFLAAPTSGDRSTVLHLKVSVSEHQLALRSLDAAIERLPCRSDRAKARVIEGRKPFDAIVTID